MKIHTHILKTVTDAAKKSDVVRGKVGAICFTNKGHIITFAHNKILYGHTKKKQFTIHAEMALLAKLVKLKAAFRFKNLNILVVRYRTETDNLGIAKPCKNCQYYLNLAGIKVFYTDYKGEIKQL